MRALFILFLFISSSTVAQTLGETIFKQQVSSQYDTRNNLPNLPVDKIFISNNIIKASYGNKTYQLEKGNTWSRIDHVAKSSDKNSRSTIGGKKVLSQAIYQNNVKVYGTEDGLFFDRSNKIEKVYPADSLYSWSLRNVTALVVDSQNRLWFGSQEGIGYLDGKNWKLFTGKEGLPYNHFTCAVAATDGEVWFGTERGAIFVHENKFAYRASKRWLPNDYVTSMAVDNVGSVWIGTKNGIAEIKRNSISLDQKANFFTDQVEARHNRMGFIAQSELKEQYNLATSQLAISDNDGMYTAMYGAAQAFRYAVTGDKEAKHLADRSFKAVKWLSDITPEKGFPARVIIPIDWHEPVNEQYSVANNERMQLSDPQWKSIFPRFPKSKDGKYRYKCDTSSDELAGHFFFYGIYFDLVAKTEQEKNDVKQVVGDMMDHLLRHGYKLFDYDGKVTRWGDFSPEYFNSVYGYDQRGLNAMMMLSFLNVTKHITGDTKYDEAAKVLREKYNYHIYALHPKEYFPAENVVPWDNNLCLMSLYGLIKYETDPSLLLMYRQSLENAWLHISKQKNAFWDAIYQTLANDFTKLVDDQYFDGKNLFSENHLYAPNVTKTYYRAANNPDYILENLQKIPLDLIGYSMPNTHRLDIVLDNSPGQSKYKGWRFDGYALPVDERGHVRQDRDGFDLNLTEGNGYAEHEGTFFILPYYMAMYHQLIEK